MTNEKSFIIDPLTCLCKFALLDIMPGDTKISISKYVLYLQEYNYLRKVERWWGTDTRFDIANLRVSVVKAIKWYIRCGPEKMEMDEILEESMINIANHAIRGLKKLQKTYSDDNNILNNLQYFQNLIRHALNDSWDEEDLVESNISPDRTLSEKIKINFNPDTINTVSKLLTDSTKDGENVKSLADCIGKLLEVMDDNFKNLMIDVNTKL